MKLRLLCTAAALALLTSSAALAAGTTAGASTGTSGTAAPEAVTGGANTRTNTGASSDRAGRSLSGTTLLAQAAGAQAPASDTADGNEDVRAVVDRVQEAYDQVTDFTANFTQEYTSVTLGETRTSRGRVFFKKPGMMRWDYNEPSQRFMISDGSTLWVYEPEFAQYYTESLTDSQLPSALRFLMGQGRLTEDFEVTIPERSSRRITLALVPRTPNSQFSMLHFVVDATSYQVRETVVFDALGNTNRLVFSSVRQNSGLPNTGFTFTPPRGATRVEGP